MTSSGMTNKKKSKKQRDKQPFASVVSPKFVASLGEHKKLWVQDLAIGNYSTTLRDGTLALGEKWHGPALLSLHARNKMLATGSRSEEKRCGDSKYRTIYLLREMLK
jgi:hypothetical protein